MALQSEPELFHEAMEKRIVIVSPTTLLVTLKTIASIWRSEYQNRNVMEIARQAGEMYDKFASFSEDLIKLGVQMDTAKKTYAEAMGKLSDGKGNLVRKAESLKELGARTSKQINARLLERAADADIIPEP
jgi:DNA recombination protein RmuC